MFGMDDPGRWEAFPASLPFSKRAARRMIQRAYVLMGRDRRLRQQVREARLLTLWILKDWNFVWTVEFERGKIHFDRRPAKRPDLTFIWRSAELFFHQIESGAPPQEGFEMIGTPEMKEFFEPVYRAFGNVFCGVMKNPYDDAGNRLD